MAYTQYYIKAGMVKEVEKEMKKTFCGADPTKPEYSCFVEPCTRISGIVAHLKRTTTPKELCIGVGFC
ncbi:hypothetical protein TELCIR_09277 [Teladorsagia circumcincta]|uniref:Surfactant protein B n=1 Tax=Teladorsagia circumcincta TaxID=45464 RepID=A0A2G9UFA9_TELCI|nr:hypothetical protein TELCIR_09277 [Teladorsagia circumcincta]